MTRLTLLLLGALAIGSDAWAQALDLEAQQVHTLSYPGATAAFAIDATIATVGIAGELITIVGRAPGATHVIVIAGGRTESIRVSVREPVPSRATNRRQAGEDGEMVAGTLETRYLSSPEILQTTIRLFRQRGERTNELVFSGTQPLGAGPETVFNIPLASYRIRNRNDELTFFDRVVDNSPLTVSRVNIRGLHARRGPWSVHTGYSFFSTFENLILPSVLEGVAGVGYRFQSTGRTVTPNIYYFHRGDAAGPGGALGTVVYESRWLEGGTLLTEVGVSRGVAAAADFELRRDSQHLWARARYIPASHPSLSVGQISGQSADLVWSESDGKLRLGTTVSAHRTATASPHTTSVASLRMDYRLGSHWTVGTSPSYSFFRAAELPDSRSERVSVPVNVGLSAGFLETTAAYEPSRQSGSGRTAQSLQGAVNAHWKTLHVSARADRQMDTPTVAQIIVEAPWLQRVVDELATNAFTPGQLAEVIRTTDALSVLGYSNELVLNVAPLALRRTFSLNWTGGGRMRPQVSLSTVLSRQEFITATVKSTMHTLTYSQSIGPVGDMFVTWSSMCSDQHAPTRSPCQSVVAANLTQNLPNVLKGLLDRGDTTTIQGTVFRDDAARGSYVEGMPAIANIEMVLDGERRTRTDGAGRFSFRGVRPGAHRVEAVFSSDSPYFFTSANPVVVRDNAVVHIGVGLSLSRLFGSVINDVGTPIGEALVQIIGPDTERTTRTGGNGQFSVQGLKAGTYEVRVDPASVPATYLVQDLKPQSVRVDPALPGRAEFVLRAYRSVLGIVRLYDVCAGTYVPVSSAAVTLKPLGIVSITDDAGRYVFRDLPAGSYTVAAMHAGIAATAPVNLPEGGALLKDVNLSLAPTEANRTACPSSAAR